MDIDSLLYQFYDEDDHIDLPSDLSLAQLCESLYQGNKEFGGGELHALRYWDFSTDREGVPVDFTRDEVITRIKAVAARLQQTGQPGDRVAIMAANSPEYIFGFMGALYANQVPVPLYDPNEPGHGEQLNAVMADSGAKVVLTNNNGAKAVREFFVETPRPERPRVLVVDSLPDSLAESYELPEGLDQVDDIAFLQYTSGSTRMPAGVVLTNRAIMTNILQLYDAVEMKFPLRLVHWLPLHHDMGIIIAVLVTMLGLPMDLMNPRDFVQQPRRWTKQVTTREEDIEEETFIYSVLPNFALDLAARYAAPENPEDLDFSQVDGLIVGSEPVTKTAVSSFIETFKDSKLDPTIIRPSYGLAEATLIVSTPQVDERPVHKHFDRDQVAAGRLVEVDENDDNGVAFVSNGQLVGDMDHAVVVDGNAIDYSDEANDGLIGELWLRGDNVAVEYLGREDETTATFRNTLNDESDTGNWLATGDLVGIYQGELYITGRIKDLVVIAGRNHYPQDIEATVMESSPHVRADSVAAFAVPGGDVEKLVLVVERADGASEDGDAQAEDAIRSAVTARHGISPEVVEFRAPGEIARSTSGKIARRLNRKKFLDD